MTNWRLCCDDRPWRRGKMYRAFTLIELLVVIAIIAILAAFLFPVFSRVRERAGDNTVVGQIAKEFQKAGVALAGGPSTPEYFQIGNLCHAQPNAYPNPSHNCAGCVSAGCAMYFGSGAVYYDCEHYANNFC